MRLFKSSRGITLVELLVATVLIGIVTTGLIAAEYSIRMGRQSSSRDNMLTTQMQALMVRLTHDANATVGDYSTPGIYLQKDGGTGKLTHACFRYAFGDINTYSDDRWACWTYDVGTKVLTSCDNRAAPVATCSGLPGFQDWSAIKYSDFGVTVYDDQGNAITPAGTITNTKIGYIKLQMIGRYDTSKSVHPIENPEYQIELNVSPVGLSR